MTKARELALLGTILAGAGILWASALPSCGGSEDQGGKDSAADTAPGGGGGCVDDTGGGGGPAPDTAPGETAQGSTGDTAPVVVDTSGLCPEGMVPVENQFCIDAFEASRPDATSTSTGSDESMAVSVGGVTPWKVYSLEEAEAACQAAGKRLCEPEEWYQACTGPEEYTYTYGDTYVADACNGIDTHCECDDGEHYEGCYSECGGAYYMVATGSMSDCTNGYGVYDMSGNLWEYVAGAADDEVRGGAYNCGDSAATHQCGFELTWTPSARGFRCCHDGYF